MVTCESHSWGIHAWWLVVKEKISVVGMVWVVQTISPVLRCHHISGSLKRARTVRKASTTSSPAIMTGKEKTRRRTREPVLFTTSGDAVLKPSPSPDHRLRRADRVQRAGSGDADRLARYRGCAPPGSCCHDSRERQFQPA